MSVEKRYLSDLRPIQQKYNRPKVTLSYAQSLDGSIAAQRGSPLQLSGPDSMRLTHELRAAHHAVLVGIGTVLADDPQLNTRLVEGSNPQPIVLDSQLRCPASAKVFQASGLPPWFFCSETADWEKQCKLEQAGGRVFRSPLDLNHRIDLGAVMVSLADLGIETLMVEGGASVITSFIANRLVDLFVITIAPMIVGGLRAVEDLLISDCNPQDENLVSPVARFPSLTDITVEQRGRDLVLWGRML